MICTTLGQTFFVRASIASFIRASASGGAGAVRGACWARTADGIRRHDKDTETRIRWIRGRPRNEVITVVPPEWEQSNAANRLRETSFAHWEFMQAEPAGYTNTSGLIKSICAKVRRPASAMFWRARSAMRRFAADVLLPT